MGEPIAKGPPVAVVGGGLLGLSIARQLIEKGFNVTLFEKKEIGAGASGAAIGILNPFVGPSAAKSKKADEALEDAKQSLLASPVALLKGLYRILPKEKVKIEKGIEWKESSLMAYGREHRGFFWIEEGFAVPIKEYLRYLGKKVPIIYEEWNERFLSDFHHLVFAIGGDLKKTPYWKTGGMRLVKGQLLTFELPKGMEALNLPLLADLHIVPTSDPTIVRVGATYEHDGLDLGPSIPTALAYMKEKMEMVVADFKSWKVVDCQAGLRVAPGSGHLPFFWDAGDKVTIASGLGSRGLLYHAWHAKRVANHIADLYT